MATLLTLTIFLVPIIMLAPAMGPIAAGIWIACIFFAVIAPRAG